MSDGTGEHDDYRQYIAGCRAFASRKREECDRMVLLLCPYPESPKPIAQIPVVFSNESISKLNAIIDTVDEDVPLVCTEEKSSSLLQPGGEKSREKYPSPIRNKIQDFLTKEYEQMCKMGSKWKKACDAASPRKKGVASADSPKLQGRIDKVIKDILSAIQEIRANLDALESVIKSFEEALIKDPLGSSGHKRRKIGVNSVKNQIYLLYREVERRIEAVKKSDKTAAEEPLEQLHAQSPSKKLKGMSPQHSSKAGPSSASHCDIGEAPSPTGTPKKTRKKSNKKKASNTKSKNGSLGQKTVSTASSKGADETEHASFDNPLFRDSSPESNAESRDTLSSKVNDSIGDLDLSETEDSKDKMEES